MVLFALGIEYLVAFVALVAIGMTESLIGVTRQQMAQLAAPPQMRGRVMSNFGTVTRGASSLSELQAGALAGVVGGPGAVFIGAAALAISTVVTALSSVGLWRFERSPSIAPDGS